MKKEAKLGCESLGMCDMNQATSCREFWKYMTLLPLLLLADWVSCLNKTSRSLALIKDSPSYIERNMDHSGC